MTEFLLVLTFHIKIGVAILLLAVFQIELVASLNIFVEKAPPLRGLELDAQLLVLPQVVDLQPRVLHVVPETRVLPFPQFLLRLAKNRLPGLFQEIVLAGEQLVAELLDPVVLLFVDRDQVFAHLLKKPRLYFLLLFLQTQDFRQDPLFQFGDV